MRWRHAVIPLGVSAILHGGLLLVPIPMTAEQPNPPPQVSIIDVETGDVEPFPQSVPRSRVPDTSRSALQPLQPQVPGTSHSSYSSRAVPDTSRGDTSRGRQAVPGTSHGTSHSAVPSSAGASPPGNSEGGLSSESNKFDPLQASLQPESLPSEVPDSSSDTSPLWEEASISPVSLPSSVRDGLPGAPRVGSSAIDAPAGFDLATYARGVRSRVESQKRYPARARRQGQQGTAVVRVVVAPNGRLRGAPVLASSSGSVLLDREALRMADAAAPFAPHSMVRAILIVIPIRFSR